MLVKELPIVRRGMLFKCKLCGQKCCNLGPEIGEDELEKIRKIYPSFKPYVSPEGKMLLLGERGYCPFLKDGLCVIHDYKPVACQLYPFYPIEKRILDDIFELPKDVEIVRHGLEEYVFLFDEECPGIGEGEPINLVELLEKFLKAKHFLKNPL